MIGSQLYILAFVNKIRNRKIYISSLILKLKDKIRLDNLKQSTSERFSCDLGVAILYMKQIWPYQTFQFVIYNEMSAVLHLEIFPLRKVDIKTVTYWIGLFRDFSGHLSIYSKLSLPISGWETNFHPRVVTLHLISWDIEQHSFPSPI